jgi:hypothetical protein
MNDEAYAARLLYTRSCRPKGATIGLAASGMEMLVTGKDQGRTLAFRCSGKNCNGLEHVQMVAASAALSLPPISLAPNEASAEKVVTASHAMPAVKGPPQGPGTPTLRAPSFR